MFGRIFSVLAIAVVLLAAFAGMRIWQEQAQATGAVETGAD